MADLDGSPGAERIRQHLDGQIKAREHIADVDHVGFAESCGHLVWPEQEDRGIGRVHQQDNLHTIGNISETAPNECIDTLLG